MSVELLGATDGRVDYGDIAALAGKTELSIALTILPDNNPGVSKRLVSQWGNTAASEQCFLMSMPSTGARRPGLVVYAGGNYFGRFCDNNVLTAGVLSRLLFTWKAGAPDVIHLWVDGVDQPISEWIGSDNVAGLLNSTRNVQVGHETDESADGADGDYAEFAIWGEVVPDWFAEAYTTHGLSPRFWQSNGILYAPLVNASSLLDEWGGVVGSATAALDAAHPSVYYPGVSPVWQPPPPPYAPAVTFGSHPSEDPVRSDFGSGVPVHAAPQGSFYYDITNSIFYMNEDGTSGGWVAVPSSPHVESLFIVAKSGAYTITASDGVVIADASGGAFTITLPTAVGIAGRVYRVKKIDATANAVTIDADGAETIDGGATATLAVQYEAITIVSDGTEWWVL
jgi:hypothetical protein